MLFPFAFGKEDILKDSSKSKKEGSITGGILGYQKIEQEHHTPFEMYQPTTVSTIIEPLAHYAPQLQFAPVTSYGYQGATTIISSPEAQISKKQVMDVTSKPQMRGTWDFPISQTAEPSYETGRETSGINATHIAIVAVLGAAGIMLIKKGSKKR